MEERGWKKNNIQATLLYVSVQFHVQLLSGKCLFTSGVFESTRQRENLFFILAQLAQILKGHHGGHTGQISGKYLPNNKEHINNRAKLPKCRRSSTYRLRDLLVLEALEVPMLLRAVHHEAVLWFHPALRHQVELRVHVYSLHLRVVVVISGEAVAP